MGSDRNSGAKRRSASARCVLALDIATDGAAWTCLGAVSPARAARKAAAAIAASLALPARRCTATVLLSGDARVRALNRQWRGLDKPTNVLSFPSAAAPAARRGTAHHLGDIVLAEETIAREAAELLIGPGDHFTHLMLHGLLHLLGYDHETDAEAETMETLETRLLAGLGISDPYAGSVPLRPQPAKALRSATPLKAR